MNSSKWDGRTIPLEEETRQALTTVAARPQRVAFLINKDLSFQELTRVIRYNTVIWGGFFNALIPIDGNTISDGWWKTLKHHDPDIVVVCGTAEQELLTEVNRRIQPFSIRGWQSIFDEEHQIDQLNNVRMLPFLSDMLKARAADDASSAIRIPEVSPDHPFFHYTIAQFGVIDEIYQEIYTQQLHAKTVRFDDSIDLASYLDTVSSILEWRYPLGLTKLQLSSQVLSMGTNSRVTLCLAGDDYIEDICAFWTVRMPPTWGHTHTVLLPMQPLESEENLRHLAQWCNQRLVGTNFMVVTSASVKAEDLKTFRSRLMPLLRDEIEFIDLWVSHFTMGRFRLSHGEQRQELTWRGNRTRVKRPLLAFDNQYLRRAANWVLDIELSDLVHQQQEFIPPDFPRLNYVLNGRPSNRWNSLGGYWMRKAHSVLSRRVSSQLSTEFVPIELPSEEDLFNELLKSFGYDSDLTDKCRYVTGMTQLLNDAGTVGLLKRPILRHLFQRLSKSRKAYDLYGIQQLTHCPKEKRLEFQNWMADLSRAGILLRGYRLRCPECNLEEWYALGDISETVSCAGCLTEFQLPFNAPFSYRLNRLVQMGIEQGAIPVILTTKLLQNLARNSLLHLAGIRVFDEEMEIDFDILAACDGHLVAVECKDLEGGCSEETATEIAEQIERLYQVACDIGVKVVFLSMMTNEKPPILVDTIGQLNQLDGPSVHLLLLEDLERGYPIKTPQPDAEDDKKLEKISFLDLLPKTPPSQGWIKEAGQRKVSF